MIPVDYYIALGIITVLGISGGLFLLFQAQKYRARSDKCEKKEAMPKLETLDEVIGHLPPKRQEEIEAGAEALSAAIEMARLKREATAKFPEKED